MKKKKLLALGMVAALGTTAVVGGTLAYFTDSEAKHNEIVVGDVDIVLNEDFDDEKPLLPGDPTDPENQVKKDVTIENKGKSDAYVRLLVAYEDTKDVGAMAWFGWNPPYATITKPLPNTDMEDQFVIPSNKKDDWLQIKDTKTNTVYTVGYVTLSEKLAAGVETDSILKTVAIHKQADNAWAEIVGEEYDVLVLAQGAQVIAGKTATESINTSFGFVMDKDADEEVAKMFTDAKLGEFVAHTYTSDDAWTKYDDAWEAVKNDPTPTPDAPNAPNAQ